MEMIPYVISALGPITLLLLIIFVYRVNKAHNG